MDTLGIKAFRPTVLALYLFVSLAILLVTGCEGDGAAGQPVTLRLGYFPNVTHAQPIVGITRGTYQQILGSDVKLEPKAFNAGPSVIEALFAGEIDASYIGPNPAINGYIRSNGEALKIVAGATSGGALFIVRAQSNINKPEDLAGKKLASPQLGNTRDVALRAYLLDHGFKPRENGGSVNVFAAANADILNLFKKGDIDGAWVPEPWGTRLINEAEGRLFLDERSLWPNGNFVTTHLIVRTGFLNKHPDVVDKLLQAHVDATLWINDHRAEASQVVVDGIKAATGAVLPVDLVNTSWNNLRITYDPIAVSLHKSADDAFALGFLSTKKPDLEGIYDLNILNRVLSARGLQTMGQ